MAKLSFVEPAADGSGAVEVDVSNPDAVTVILSDDDINSNRWVALSYWQLERITKRIREEYAFQLDREEKEQTR